MISVSEHAGKEDDEEILTELTERDVSQAVGSSLVDKYNIEAEIKKKQAEGVFRGLGEEVDDGSMHKFVSVQFNENVVCAFCSKKIWFKSAYQCAFCGYIIHLKCYEKTIGKAICPRFYSKQQQQQQNAASTPTATKTPHDDQFVVIQAPDSSLPSPVDNAPRSFSSLEQAPPPPPPPPLPKSLVSNFISGIRQRASKRFQDSDLPIMSSPSSSQHSASASSTPSNNNGSGSGTKSSNSSNSILNSLYSNFNKSRMVFTFIF
jgi:hypothetical protein